MNNFLIVVNQIKDNNLDPSLFQNVVLGILAFFIPLGIAILTYFLEERAKGNIDSNLKLFVLLEEVLKVKIILFSSVFVLIILIFYNYSLFFKAVSLFAFIFYLIWLFLVPFKNIWKWFFEADENFTIKFLDSLTKNVIKNKIIIFKSWEGLWKGKEDDDIKKVLEEIKICICKENKIENNYNGINKEKEYTEIFCEHVNKFLEKDDYVSAVEVAEFYENNLEKRNSYFVSTIIFQNLVEWIKYEMKFENDRNWKNKHIIYDGDLYFFHHFIYDIFNFSGKDKGHRFSNLFDVIKNEKDDKFLKTFFLLFFDFIKKYCIEGSENDIDFIKKIPKEWKIKIENYNNLHQKIIFNEFFREIYLHHFLEGYNTKKNLILNEIILEIFPEVDPDLFSKSLSLFIYPNENFIKGDAYLMRVVYRAFDDEEFFKIRKNEKLKTIELLKLIMSNFYGNKKSLIKLKEKFEKIETENEIEKDKKKIALEIIDKFLETFKNEDNSL